MKLSKMMVLLIGLSLSSCVTLLNAPFDTDALGANPDKSLPGSPSGDELTYISAIENRLEIVDWESSRSLEISNLSPTTSSSGHTSWTSFKSKRTTFSTSVSYSWNGQANFGGLGSDFIMDFGDGVGGQMVRLKLSRDGALSYTTNYNNDLPIGTLTLNQRHNIIITCNKVSRTFSIRVSQGATTLSESNLGFLNFGQSLATNARPSVGFNYSSSSSNPQQSYLLDDLLISRPKREGE